MGLIGFYVVLGGLLYAAWAYLPAFRPLIEAGRSPVVDGKAATSRTIPAEIGVIVEATVAMVGALLVTLPVAWIYVLTRRRKGFTQSIVHTLLILPLTVAGVVLLVQDSLALAFSLAGIAAAVRFRNTLEDTKDAVYIFVATGTGIAAAVGHLGVGMVLSVLFNIVILVLWWTEFGRSPFDLEGPPAERRLEEARTGDTAGSEFVSKLDREVLAAMSTDQLEELADLAFERRLLSGESGAKRYPFNAVVRIHAQDPRAAQAAAEKVFAVEVRRFELVGLKGGDGGFAVIEYRVRLGKSVSREDFARTLRESAPSILAVEVREA